MLLHFGFETNSKNLNFPFENKIKNSRFSIKKNPLLFNKNFKCLLRCDVSVARKHRTDLDRSQLHVVEIFFFFDDIWLLCLIDTVYLLVRTRTQPEGLFVT